MRKFSIVFLIPILVSSTTASFSFFGFGGKPTEDNLEAAASDAVSQSSHSIGSRFIPQSITNILFGTGTSNSETGSTSGPPSTPGSGLFASVPAYPGPSVQSLPASTASAYGSAPSPSAPSYGSAPSSAPGYGSAPSAPAYGSTPAALSVPSYAGVPAAPASPSPSGYGSAPPSSPPASYYGGYKVNNNAQAAPQNQNNYYSTAALPQSNSAGLSVHSSNLPSNSPAHASGMPLLHPGNTQSHLTPLAATTTHFQNQQYLGQGQASHTFQTSNGIRFNEETNTDKNQQASVNNPGTSKKGSFSWVSPEGQNFEVQYVADAKGYRPSGSHLPSPPSAEPSKDQHKAGQGSQPNPPSTSYGSVAPPPNYSYSQFKPSQPVPARPY